MRTGGEKKRVEDQYQRKIDYVRISVTDRCNFRCKYCMPEEGVESIAHSEIMTYEEILRFIRIAVRIGIKKVKITGGEPLVRKGVCGLMKELRETSGIESVTLTTNGVLLGRYLPELKEAGISGINISLDTLCPKRFRQITRRDGFSHVWKGIENAVLAEIPVKINCVPMRGFNEDEIPALAALAKDSPVSVRFIEMMPVGLGKEYTGIFQEELMKMLEAEYGVMEPDENPAGNGPAKYYRLTGFRGRVGFISAVSHRFCENCNRIRLTADGILKPCLNYESKVNIKGTMRGGANDAELEKLLKDSIYAKPRCHGFTSEVKEGVTEKRKMAGIGG